MGSCQLILTQWWAESDPRRAGSRAWGPRAGVGLLVGGIDSDMAAAGLQGSWGLEFTSGGQGEGLGIHTAGACPLVAKANPGGISGLTSERSYVLGPL